MRFLVVWKQNYGSTYTLHYNPLEKLYAVWFAESFPIWVIKSMFHSWWTIQFLYNDFLIISKRAHTKRIYKIYFNRSIATVGRKSFINLVQTRKSLLVFWIVIVFLSNFVIISKASSFETQHCHSSSSTLTYHYYYFIDIPSILFEI